MTDDRPFRVVSSTTLPKIIRFNDNLSHPAVPNRFLESLFNVSIPLSTGVPAVLLSYDKHRQADAVSHSNSAASSY
jgi:hypothetical protein